MAAIERKPRVLSSALLALLLITMPCRADRVSDVRARITYVASALASGNPADALSVFDKNLSGYSKLDDYFRALTASFDIVNEVEITDEDDEQDGTTVKANWTLHLSDRTAGSDRQKVYAVTIGLKPVGKKWQIVSFSPVEMFNPQGAATFGK